ncbi:MAG: FlgD immunoglobulin-like domain containing protein [candidate division WOR-3 bacterium]
MRHKSFLLSSVLISILCALTVPKSTYGEFLIDTSVVFLPAPYDQKSSGVAYDGINYMVVWADWRSSDANIYCARVNTSGQLLDLNGIVISSAPSNQKDPAIAFDGNNYLVVWADDRNQSSSYTDIYCARVSTTGTVLDPNGIPISTAASNQVSPAVAFDGTNYLVVWADYRNGNNPDIYGARITPEGTVLDPDGIPVATSIYSEDNPAIAFDGMNYLVIWQVNIAGDWNIYGTRIDQNGNVLNPNGFAISEETNHQWYPAVAFDGTNYLVVWSDRRNSAYDQIYGARVTQSGGVLDPNGIPIATSATYGQYFPALAFDGVNYFVVWDDYRSSSHNIMGARVTPGGIVLDPNGRYVSNAARDQLYPAITFGGENYFATWDDYRSNSDFDIYGARVDPSGNCLDYNGIIIVTSINYQYTPNVAFDGTNYLVVWEDSRGIAYSNIKGARVSQSGIVLDPGTISITTATNDQISPAVAFDGTNYLVVWGDQRNGVWDIYGTRVSQSGTVLNPAGIAISTAANYQEYPAVAFDDTNYLVVWQDKRGGTYYDIYGTRVTPSGTVLNPSGIGISTAGNDQLAPSVAFDGTNYLVVWEDCRNNSTIPDIYCTRVNRSGTVLNPAGIAVSTAASHQYTPKVAFGGTNYLVVWADNRNGNWDIYGARVTPTGTVLDPNGIAICTNNSTQLYPNVAFDGTNYIVVWSDTRNGDFDIYGAQVTTTGIVLNTFVVSSRLGSQLDPALTIGTGNQICTVYSGFTNEINGIPVNTMRIWCHQYSLIGLKEKQPPLNPADKTTLLNLPNPFKENTLIKFQVQDANCEISLIIYDSQGRLIKRLLSKRMTLGVYHINWDGTDDNGKKVGSGVYLCYLQNGAHCEIRRMVLIK